MFEIDDIPPGGSFRDRLAHAERQLLIQALEQSDWNQTSAANLLELPLRTLARKIKNLDIKRNR